MIEKGPGDLNVPKNRPNVIEDFITECNYEEYKYMMFMLPILLDAYIVVETGMGLGGSPRIHLSALSMLKPPRVLHSYEYRGPNDVDFGQPYQTTVDKIKAHNFKAEWQVHLSTDSVQGGKDWNHGNIDLLYLDSDHSQEHVTNELNAWSPHMAKKCIIYTDDTWASGVPHAYCSKMNPGVNPTDPYWSMHLFAEAHPEWRELNFTYPQGKSLLLRGFDVI